MPTSSKAKSLRARAAAARRWDSPEADDLARELREHMLEQHIREVVDSAPPLSDEQRERLAAILAPTSGSAA